MKYIEFIGVPASGKSFYKKKFETKFDFISKHRLIINFFLEKNINFKQKFICYFLIFYYSKFITYFKNFIKPKRTVFKIKNKIIFSSTQSNSSIIRKHFNLNQYYENIIKEIFLKHSLEKNVLYTFLNKKIKIINQNEVFKKRLNFWIIENLVCLYIVNKKKEDNRCLILDEGIVHRISLVFSLLKNNKNFLNKALKLHKFIGKIYYIEVSKNQFNKNINKRIFKNEGFIYKKKNFINKELISYTQFVRSLQKKIKIYKILN